MLKFELTASSEREEGFKLKVQADSPEEMKVVNDLTSKLIDKISVIQVKIGDSGENS